MNSLNFRLNEIQSALGISQLKKIKSFISKREKIYNIYNKELKNISGLSMPEYSKNYFPSFHLCLALLKRDSLEFKEKFIKFMLKKKIMIQYHYIPIYKFSIFNEKYIGKNAQKYYKNAISLPVYYKLDQKQQYQIISYIKSFFLKNRN